MKLLHAAVLLGVLTTFVSSQQINPQQISKYEAAGEALEHRQDTGFLFTFFLLDWRLLNQSELSMQVKPINGKTCFG